ncbi:DsbA family protein [Glutamicibacter sp. AOP12-B1-11]|uniref:DsbA family protein n=1 Tax=Glutamicibacter sp. AOP12-B1-11 TaxID=3457725 RepID=UPI004033CCF4
MTPKVSLIIDIACTWSYIAFERVASVISDQGGDLDTYPLGFLPHQLDPSATTTGEPLLRVLRERFGPGVDQENERVRAIAAMDGITLDYASGIHSNTFDAHRAIYDASQAGRGASMVRALFRAHFSEGKNIADPIFLEATAQGLGVELTRDESTRHVRESLDFVREKKISAVPVLLWESGATLTGMHSKGDLADLLH